MAISNILGPTPRSVITVSPNATVMDTVRIMNQHRIGAVVVLDQDELVGIFTERDILKRLIAESRDPERTLVRRVMTTEPTTITPDETIENALSIMTEKRHRHLPVLRDGQLVGIVSIGDIIRALLEKNEMEATHLRSYISGY